MQRLIVLSAVFMVSMAATAGEDDASKADLKKMQGKWRPISIVADGKPQEVSPNSVYHFEGNKNIYDGSGKYFDVITLNAKSDPKELTFDNVQKDGPTTKGVKAIYRFDGDKLVLCVAPDPKAARPKTFESKEKSGHRLITLERLK
jgi:uncharacterized protein (TIGR03067 family)